MANSEERWRQLCAQAAEEQDPQKLMELVKEISRLLEEKQQRPHIDRDSPEPEGGKPPTKRAILGIHSADILHPEI